jgi:hypothetical protein
MNEKLPLSIGIVFALTTILTITLFYQATNRSRTTLFILLGWIVLQAIVSFSGFYLVEDTIPPRMALLAGPALLFIIGLFLTANGRSFLDSLNLKKLTGLHSIRIVVELVLYGLFLHEAVPQLMTFAGRNFDILAGLSAPVAVYFGFVNSTPKKTFLVAWNILCILLLVNIVSLAVLSAPTPLQLLAFDQPDIAILYFPFVWLPCCVVPLVLLSHLASLRLLLKK